MSWKKMKWYKEEFIFSLQIGVIITLWVSWMDWMLSDYELDYMEFFDLAIMNAWLYIGSVLFGIFLIKLFSKKYRNTNIVNPQKSKPFLPAHVKTQAEKEYHKLVRKFKSKHKRNPSNNECVKIAIKTSHNIDTHKGSKGHMRRQKVRKHLVLKYKLRDKFTMSKPKGN